MPSHRRILLFIALATLSVPTACTQPEDAPPPPPAISGPYDSWAPGTDMALTLSGRKGGRG